jgi:hypothetical protein
MTSVLELDYSFGDLVGTSKSEFNLLGPIWQEFGLDGTVKGLHIQSDLLFGPLTEDFLYAQLIASTHIFGMDAGVYAAQLGGAVLGGPAAGIAVRLAKPLRQLDIAGIIELGARIRDEEQAGITIVHAASGLSKSYITDPTLVGWPSGGSITIAGPGHGWIDTAAFTLYGSGAGIESLTLKLAGGLDMRLTIEPQDEIITFVPRLNLGKSSFFVPYAALMTGGTGISISGLNLYGIEFSTSMPGIYFRTLGVLDPVHYVIATREGRNEIERIDVAIAAGHDYHPDSWGLATLELTASEEGSYTVQVENYFRDEATSVFDWEMAQVETEIPFGSDISFTEGTKVGTRGLNSLGLGVKVNW